MTWIRQILLLAGESQQGRLHSGSIRPVVSLLDRLPHGSYDRPAHRGAVAQLGERGVRNAEVGSSILLRSTPPTSPVIITPGACLEF